MMIFNFSELWMSMSYKLKEVGNICDALKESFYACVWCCLSNHFVLYSSSGTAMLQWVCGDTRNRGWNLQVVWCLIQHPETKVNCAFNFVTLHYPCMSKLLHKLHVDYDLFMCTPPGLTLRVTGLQIWTRMCTYRTSTVSALCVKLISESCPTLCSHTSFMTSLLWVFKLIIYIPNQKKPNIEDWNFSSKLSIQQHANTKYLFSRKLWPSS